MPKFTATATRIDTFTKEFEAEDKATAEAKAEQEAYDLLFGDDTGWNLNDFQQEVISVRSADSTK